MALHLISKDQPGVSLVLRAGDKQKLGRRKELGIPPEATQVSRECCLVTAFSTVSGQLALHLEAKKRLVVVDAAGTLRVLKPGGSAQVGYWKERAVRAHVLALLV
jgi:hypothetical protein